MYVERRMSRAAPADRHIDYEADCDLVVCQYVNDFADGLIIQIRIAANWPLADTIVYAHLTTMAQHPGH